MAYCAGLCVSSPASGADAAICHIFFFVVSLRKFILKADVYVVVKHHVVFGSIVAPGVVYVEMAMQATRELFGHEAKLTDINMVFPFVVPERVTDADKTMVMRFVLRGETKF